MKRFDRSQFSCAVDATITLIGGKYKAVILYHLSGGALHYMELQRLIPKATAKMLSQQLKELEEWGFIQREVLPEKPPRTRYSLTDFGLSVIPVVEAMCRWGKDFLRSLEEEEEKEIQRKIGPDSSQPNEPVES